MIRGRSRFVGGIGWGSLALALAPGCGDGLALPPGWTATEAAAFQRQHEAEIGTPTGPLSTVASHYVGPGQTLVLGVAQGSMVTDPPPGGPRLRIEVTDEGARCHEGCGPGVVALRERRQLTLDRFTLSVSPQSGTLRVLIHDPQSAALRGFAGLSWFPVDPAFIVPARFEPDEAAPTVALSTSRGLTKPFVRAGVLRARLRDEDLALVGYRAGAQGSLLVPMTDATTADRSYPVGRYLEVTLPESGPAVLDFNRLTNPWCAYSEHYNCPVPPEDNRVARAVEAGERTYAVH